MMDGMAPVEARAEIMMDKSGDVWVGWCELWRGYFVFWFSVRFLERKGKWSGKEKGKSGKDNSSER